MCRGVQGRHQGLEGGRVVAHAGHRHRQAGQRDAVPVAHRYADGDETAPVRETGSSVYQVFDGSGTVTVGETTWSVTRGDLFVVPSWQPLSVRSEAGSTDSDSGALDLFRFSDSPVFEALRLDRTHVGGTVPRG